MTTRQVRIPAKSATVASVPTRPSVSGVRRSRATSRTNEAPSAVHVTPACEGTWSPSHASRRSPDARDSRWTSPTGANAPRFPVVVPLDNAHEGEQGGGGADALLLTVTSLARKIGRA